MSHSQIYKEARESLVNAELELGRALLRYKDMAFGEKCTNDELLELITAVAYLQSWSLNLGDSIKKVTQEAKEHVLSTRQ